MRIMCEKIDKAPSLVQPTISAKLERIHLSSTSLSTHTGFEDWDNHTVGGKGDPVHLLC